MVNGRWGMQLAFESGLGAFFFRPRIQILIYVYTHKVLRTYSKNTSTAFNFLNISVKLHFETY